MCDVMKTEDPRWAAASASLSTNDGFIVGEGASTGDGVGEAVGESVAVDAAMVTETDAIDATSASVAAETIALVSELSDAAATSVAPIAAVAVSQSSADVMVTEVPIDTEVDNRWRLLRRPLSSVQV
jgi:hypothetical protein